MFVGVPKPVTTGEVKVRQPEPPTPCQWWLQFLFIYGTYHGTIISVTCHAHQQHHTNTVINKNIALADTHLQQERKAVKFSLLRTQKRELCFHLLALSYNFSSTFFLIYVSHNFFLSLNMSHSTHLTPQRFPSLGTLPFFLVPSFLI